MAAITVPNTFSNGTAADATAVNANFDAITDGLSDGTKDITISAVTANGAATFNGAVTLGNATGDDIIVTGRVAADFDPKTASTYDMGDATQLWKGVYANDAFLDRGAVGTPSHSFHADTDTGMWSSGANVLDFAVNGSNRLTLTTTTATFTGALTTAGGSFDGAVVINEAGADVDFRVEGDTLPNLLFVDASTDRVGINTNVPTFPLDIIGADADHSVRIEGTATNSIASLRLTNDVRSFRLSTDGTNSDKFTIKDLTEDLNRFSIDSSGNVGIGATAASFALDVNGSGGDHAIRVESTGTNSVSGLRVTNDAVTWRLAVDGGNSDAFVIKNLTAGTDFLAISTAGTFTGSSTNDISDARTKTEIKPLTVGLDTVMKFKPYSYYKSVGEDRLNYGYTTQDMEKILPNLVADGLKIGGVRMKALHYGDIHAIHTVAIQELNRKIEALMASRSA